MAKTKLNKKTKKTSAVKAKVKTKAKAKAKAKVTAKTKAVKSVKSKPSAVKKTTKVAASKKAVVTKVAKAKVKVKASAPKVALKKESDKKKPNLAKTSATTEPILDPGLLTKQQVRSLERLIQKNAEWVQISSVLQQNARPYKMQDSFQERMAIKHPVLGLGYVTLAENHKMTVLFEDGPRNLIMNYKS